eukprot:TRINITY_DN1075_c0_g3_i2.p1 TRINITY_DN1075_c0_g3~~TRINITY_DN1075_c0_g3_i2.p1  ORF type:complete len:543 (+),score=76.84 TRINITY_DN1075_c0_g3_i2:548-2176(+)
MLHFFDLSPQTRVPLMLVVSLLNRTNNSETLKLLFTSLFKKLQTNISKTKQWNVSLQSDRDEMRNMLGLDLVIEAVSLCKSDSLTDQFWKIVSPSTFSRLWKYCVTTDLQRGSFWAGRVLCVEPAACCGNVRLLEYLLGSLEGPQANERFASMTMVAAMAHRQEKVISLASGRGATVSLTTAVRFENMDVLRKLLKDQKHKEDVADVISAFGVSRERHFTKAVVLLQPTAKTVLETSRGDLCGKIGDNGNSIVGVALLLRSNVLFQTLNLANNNIGPNAAISVAKMLQDNTSLQILHLDNNNIGPEGASAIAQALQHNTSLKALDLYNNNIGPNGASAIAQALQDNISIQALYLDNNNIGSKGASAIARALRDNTFLHVLYLGYNNIGAEGASAIAQALQHNTSLKTLGLRDNNIGSKGASAVALHLRRNASLQILHLENNNIGLKALHLDDNDIGYGGACALVRGLLRNSNLRTIHLENTNSGTIGSSMIAELFYALYESDEEGFSYRYLEEFESSRGRGGRSGLLRTNRAHHADGILGFA